MLILIENIINDPSFPEGMAWKHRQFQTNDIIVPKDDLGKSFLLIQEGLLRVAIDVEVGERRKIQAGGSDLFLGRFRCLSRVNEVIQ